MSWEVPSKWRVENLLVAGRRVSGETWALSANEAARNVAARKAREFGANVGAAVAGALKDNLRRVTASNGNPDTAAHNGESK